MNYLKFLGVICILFLCSCSSDKLQNKKETAELKYVITLGESGGFTGNNSGYIIDRAGNVGKYSGIIEPSKNAVPKGRLNNEQIIKLNELIPDLIKINYSEKGNLTSYITLSKGEEKIRFSWPGTTPGNNVPEPVRKFYSELTTVINSL